RRGALEILPCTSSPNILVSPSRAKHGLDAPSGTLFGCRSQRSARQIQSCSDARSSRLSGTSDERGMLHMTRQIMAIALVAALVASVFCSATWAAQSDDPGPVRVGDRWSYDLKDGATGDLRQAFTYVVAEINDREIITRLTPKGHENRTQTVVYDLNWAIVDNGDWQYRPGEVGIKT